MRGRYHYIHAIRLVLNASGASDHVRSAWDEIEALEPEAFMRRIEEARAAEFEQTGHGNPYPEHVVSALPALIYFLRERHLKGETTEFVKIGRSGHPVTRRSAELQTGNPRELIIVGRIPCRTQDALELEQALHAYFEPAHVRGEWFALPRDVLYGELAVLSSICGLAQ